MTSLQNYQIIKQLGQGAVGTVYLVLYENQYYALKMIKIFEHIPDFLNDAILEVNLQKNVQFDGAVKVINHFQYDNYFCIIMEYCNFGTVETILQQFQDSKNYLFTYALIDEIMIQLMNALANLHKLRICHKDIKPANVLFNYENQRLQLKLADFGCSEYSSQSLLQQMSGTREYQSPEQQEGEHTFSVDIWAAGCVLYFLIFGEAPFANQREIALMQFKQTGNKDFVHIIPQFYSNLIRSMIQQKSSARLNPEEILAQYYQYSRIDINNYANIIVGILGSCMLEKLIGDKIFDFRSVQYITTDIRNYVIIVDQFSDYKFVLSLIRILKTKSIKFVVLVKDIYAEVPQKIFKFFDYMIEQIIIYFENPVNQKDRIIQKLIQYFK
ncbi:Kinase [Spironucleus salmonicida]|uniref:Kinase n=1 Tax=Spironucleus salmonicida TaxID=348837 RepID=V6LSA0_9EUKA|nr:Kinase [Spironucleus salmonicida]|eukprot:EST46571.1 Kinase [Spironucleus salmonicida]